MAETISVTSMHRVSCLTSFSSKKLEREALWVCSVAQIGTYHTECVKKVTDFLLVNVKSNTFL